MSNKPDEAKGYVMSFAQIRVSQSYQASGAWTGFINKGNAVVTVNNNLPIDPGSYFFPPDPMPKDWDETAYQIQFDASETAPLIIVVRKTYM